MAVGKGKVSDDGKLQALEVKAGDRVLYGKYSGTEITTKEGERAVDYEGRRYLGNNEKTLPRLS